LGFATRQQGQRFDGQLVHPIVDAHFTGQASAILGLPALAQQPAGCTGGLQTPTARRMSTYRDVLDRASVVGPVELLSVCVGAERHRGTRPRLEQVSQGAVQQQTARRQFPLRFVEGGLQDHHGAGADDGEAAGHQVVVAPELKHLRLPLCAELAHHLPIKPHLLGERGQCGAFVALPALTFQIGVPLHALQDLGFAPQHIQSQGDTQ